MVLFSALPPTRADTGLSVKRNAFISKAPGDECAYWGIQENPITHEPRRGSIEQSHTACRAPRKKTIAPIEKHPSPTVQASEQPYQVPEYWRWVRLGDVYVINPAVEGDDRAACAITVNE